MSLRFFTSRITTALLALVVLTMVAVPSVSAIEVFDACTGTTDSSVCDATDSDSLTGANGIIRTIVNILLFVAGTIAVIMVVVGGIKYVVSGGDNSAVNNAKNTILYALIGVGVTIASYAIVNFVVSAL